MKRRKFIENSAMTAAGLSVLGFTSCSSNKSEQQKQVEKVVEAAPELFFKLSLAEYSFHNMLFDGKMDHLDIIPKARELNFEGVEYVTQFFQDKSEDSAYLTEMKNRANQEGVQSLLIMVDHEGNLADSDDNSRIEAVENHYKWVEAAAFLGCHSLRVNAEGGGTPEEQKMAGIDGLGRLSEFAAKSNISIIVENHGGMSSNGEWVTDLIKQVNMPNCGLLPDFGNFCVKEVEDEDGNETCLDMYDRYKGVEMMMPYAKAVSAKANAFDAEGNETSTDFYKMVKIVKDAGYSGFIGVESETDVSDEQEGVILTRDLLIKAGTLLA